MQQYQSRLQRQLDAALSDIDVPPRLLGAMRYSVLSGGKRVRAMLVYAAGEAVGAPLERLDAIAMALECMHAYSLIHDDLPAMDDDALRRGVASNHIEFDEATAILAGDALQSFAYELINRPESHLSDVQCRVITQHLSRDAGAIGMVGGQSLDIDASSVNAIEMLSLEQLENVHSRKTGALIRSAVVCGALASDQLDPAQQKQLTNYADSIGLAFQIVDDILDIESSTEQLGKTIGADVEQGKMTYPAIIGLAESKNMAEKLYQQAIASLSAISDNTQLLQDLAELIVRRKN